MANVIIFKIYSSEKEMKPEDKQKNKKSTTEDI